MPRCIVHGASSPEKAQGQPHLRAGGTQRPRPQAPRPRGRPKANITQAWRLGCLATRARARPPARTGGGRPREPIYLFFLLSSPELDAQEQQEEEEGEAAGGQVPQPPPRRPAA